MNETIKTITLSWMAIGRKWNGIVSNGRTLVRQHQTLQIQLADNQT